MGSEYRYRYTLIALLKALLRYILLFDVIVTIGYFILFRKDASFLSGRGIATWLFAGLFFGVLLGTIVFLLSGLKSEYMESLGIHGMFVGLNLFTMNPLSGGFLMMFIWFVFRLIVAFFYGVTFMPVTMVYLAIMSVIELFVDLPEDVCDFADKIPKILSVILVIVLVIKFLIHL